VPVELTGSRQAAIVSRRTDPVDRATFDWDDYSSGFAIWSGTSFAAPWIAGEIAAEIVRAGDGTAKGPNPTPRIDVHGAMDTVVKASNARLKKNSGHGTEE
ncbi:MAG: hypothetical protein ACRCZD_22580, partial [Phycicoccus sp.]